MNRYRKFSFIILAVLVIFLLFHFTLWSIFTNKVNTTNYHVGDLSRMSYHLGTITKRSMQCNLKKQHINFDKYKGQQIDMLTIGDSYSNGGGCGLNSYYQDYIATDYNLKVLNILNLKGSKNYIESVIVLANNGWLEAKGVKYVIIESIQRACTVRFSQKNIDLNKTTTRDIDRLISNQYDVFHPKQKDKQKIKLINTLNINALKYNLEYFINGYGKGKEYYIEKLDRDFFTSQEKSTLIFYKDDIGSLKNETVNRITQMNTNLNKLATILKEKGIKLYFMPAVDKYNLYRPYIISNSYPKSNFFKVLRKLHKKYQFIDTKEILRKELNKGVQDLYFSDDTHWNYKAIEAVLKNVKFEKK